MTIGTFFSAFSKVLISRLKMEDDLKEAAVQMLDDTDVAGFIDKTLKERRDRKKLEEEYMRSIISSPTLMTPRGRERSHIDDLFAN